MKFNTQHLQPEARELARRAAEMYYRHTRTHFIGLLVHGSAFKGGVIPHCSDLDLQLFLDDGAFGPDGKLPLERTLGIHAELAAIDPAPFHYIQCYAPPAGAPSKGRLGPLPGTYCMLAGTLPVPEATAEEALKKAQTYLDAYEPDPSDLAQKLLQHGGGVLERHVRYLCTEVWPLLYTLLVWRERAPLAVWPFPKPQAIKRWPADEETGRAIRRFYRCTWRYYVEDSTVENALEVIRAGTDFKRAGMAWYADTRQARKPSPR